MMLMLQISAAQGPQECALAVGKTLRRIEHEAAQQGVSVTLVEHVPSSTAGAFLSVLLTLEGNAAHRLAASWQGTVQWICQSPYRPHHARKNWFIGVAVYTEAQAAQMSEIRFEACRASRPGGQHVNKTDSAIRATHIATGISVKVQSQRSQHANKRLAALLIEQKLAEAADKATRAQRTERHLQHHDVARGDAVRIFKGEKFEPVG